MKKRTEVSSAQVLAALREGPFRAPAFAFLQEVRNGTGYGRQERYADALAVSCWPSRGLFIAGIEVKVSRQDWKRELDDPAKSADIQRWCDYWWIAAPPDVVVLAEVPETWGLYVVDGKKVTVAKEAPKLTPEPLTTRFVASILRNAGADQDRLRKIGYDEGHQAAVSGFDAEAVASLKGELHQAKRANEIAERDRDYARNETEALRRTLREFETGAGLPEGSLALKYGSYREFGGPIGEQFKAAQLLAQQPPGELAAKFRAVADALAALTTEAEGPVSGERAEGSCREQA